jgi:16S rRNA (guanine527-N7)-methyltransferase
VTSEAIDAAIRNAGLGTLDRESSDRFEAYLRLLLKWNSKLNLTAIRDPGDVLRRHFVECIQCAQALPRAEEGATLLDFGSGAGLPGIPISICRPEIRVTLTESQGKKSAFLREAVRALELDAEVFHGRVEEMAPDRVFSYVTLRAVDKMREACRAAVPRLEDGGQLAVFSTKEKVAELESALPEIEWRGRVQLATLQDGEILFGQRK